MNDYEQEKSQNQQPDAEPKVLDKIKIQMDKSNDNTPVKFNDGAIDNVEIELEENNPDLGNKQMANDPEVILTNQDNVPTDANLNAPATDRKLINDLNANTEQVELDNHLKKNSQLFPTKDDENELFERKGGICRPCFRIIKRLILYLGALLSFVNFTGDLLYLCKAPFFQHWMWPLIAFLSARYLICLILACVWMQRNKDLKRSQQVSQKMTFYMVVLEFFSDFGGMPVIITFGLYRILPMKHFSKDIKIGYAIELFTSLIPVFFIMLMNNASNPDELNWLVVTLFTTRLYAIVNFGIEIIIVISQTLSNARQRQQNNPLYKKKTLDEKIDKYGIRLANYTILSIIVFLVLLIVGLGFIDDRICDKADGNVLFWGVCTPCNDDKCIDCWHGAHTCSACKDGYHADPLTGKCLDCDSNPDEVMCKICKMPNDQGVADCLQCSTGYHLDHKTKQCIHCEDTTGVPNCANCNGGECTACLAEHYFSEVGGKKTCAKCSGTFEFCEDCSNSKCTKCQENIATFDTKGQCRECTAPWQKVENGWPHCQCPEIIDVKDDYKCKTCDQVMSGCSKCEYAVQKDHYQLGKQVGWDTMLSGQGDNYFMDNQFNYINVDKSEGPQWIVCTDGDNMKAVNVIINQTHQEILDIEKGDVEAYQAVISQGPLQPGFIETVRQCNDVIDNCAECHLDETQVTCKKCESGNYIDEVSSANLLYAVSTVNECKSCNEFSEHCLECNKYNGCTKCAPTYQTIENQKGCFKCLYEFLCD